MKFETELRAAFASEREAEIAAKSLRGELGFRAKSEGSAETKGRTLIVKLSASDLPSLRASTNSALRLLQVARAAIEVAKR
ncbi:MAG: KEOPS complex subunit Pcc1 [Candidatus Micrarchaeia archaeon]